jgi:hypothetical protein
MNNPKVISGEFSTHESFDEFSKNFNDTTGLGKIERIEWDDYYAAVSSQMDNDEHFETLLCGCWSL